MGPYAIKTNNIDYGLVLFYGKSTIEGYFMQNTFYAHKQFYFKDRQLNVKIVLFQTIQLRISTEFKCQNSSIPNNSF